MGGGGLLANAVPLYVGGLYAMHPCDPLVIVRILVLVQGLLEIKDTHRPRVLP